MCEEEYRGRSMKILICCSSTVIDTLGNEFPLTIKRESVGNKVIVGAVIVAIFFMAIIVKKY